jgi:hypothetical protein
VTAGRWRARVRRLASAAVIAGACLGVVVTRAVWEGRGALAAGDAAMERGDVEEAIARWRRAARWYAPGAPHVGRAYDRLEGLARSAEERGDRRLALEAWQAIRSSLRATRSFYAPHGGRAAEADDRIAAHMAALEDPALDPGKTEAERAAWHRALLARDEAPRVGWGLLAVLGFAAWVGGGLLFAWRGVTAEDRLDARQAARAGLLVAAGVLAWLLGLAMA